MTTQTTEREKALHLIGALPDSAMPMINDYLDFVRYRLERVPNAETIAAMEEAERGNLKSFTSIADLMADLHADNPED